MRELVVLTMLKNAHSRDNCGSDDHARVDHAINNCTRVGCVVHAGDDHATARLAKGSSCTS